MVLQQKQEGVVMERVVAHMAAQPRQEVERAPVVLALPVAALEQGKPAWGCLAKNLFLLVRRESSAMKSRQLHEEDWEAG